jgi:hypothetical protein
MRFALIDNKLVEAAPGLQGLCSGCFQPVIAKCGTQRIHHWSHRNSKTCDSWWEPETQWHRAWKNNFPVEWQEQFLPDQRTGEKHIADVRTSHGLVIEFQHSHIPPQERIMRENFYQMMVWVVDGTRLTRDYVRFHNAVRDFRTTDMQNIFLVEFPDECFPSAWLKSSVPVIFDFNGIGSVAEFENKSHDLYCLFPNQGILDARVAQISQKAFIKATINGEWLLHIRRFMDKFDQKRRDREAERERQQDQMITEIFFRPKQHRKRW